MPTYTVRCRVDAYIDYLAEVEADSPEAQGSRDQRGAGQPPSRGLSLDARVYRFHSPTRRAT